MQIYLLRHGIAESNSVSGLDADRELTEEGRQKVRDVAEAAARAGFAPTLIMSSPYRRALSTARIAVEVFGIRSGPLRADALMPGTDPRPAWEEIRVHRNEAAVLLVGHEPLFGYLGAFLLGVPELNIDFKKGALLAVEMNGFGERPAGILKWMLTAKLAG